MSYIDDSGLAAALKEANHVMSGLSGRVEMSSADLVERARRMAAATKAYTGGDGKPAPHFIEDKAKMVKRQIETHVDMLKKTASHISQIKDRLNIAGNKKIFSPGLKEIIQPEIGNKKKLNEYNQKIDNSLKNLTTKTKGNTKTIEKVKKYRDIMGEVEGELKDPAYPVKERKDKMTHHFDRKYAQKVDDRVEELSNNINNFDPRLDYDDPYDDFEGYGSDDEEDRIGDWAKYEGFNCKEDLDKYNKIFEEIVGETPEECMKKQKELFTDKTGKLTEEIQKDKITNRFSFDLDDMQKEGITKKEESERRLVEILAKMTKKDDSGSVYQDRKFLDKYVDKKLNETIHIPKTTSKREAKGKKRDEPKKPSNSERLSDGVKEKLSLDGPKGNPATVEDDVPKQSKRRDGGKSPKKLDYMSEMKMDSESFDIPKPNTKTVKPDNKSIEWDIDRVKKLILKERQEHLQKKREAWERNNELCEEVLTLEDDKKNKKKPNYDLLLPNNKPRPSDFITDREKHDKLYRKAVKGREGIFHKEDLEYEFGVNPFYLSKKEMEGNQSINIKGYEGVRKKGQTT